ncbi:MAG: hypothetical protein R3321_05825, partial [Nitrososphaeraceae archaeon]|nr:hypothetical protein [Nitrososphaeraceae archaeon]
MNEKNLFKTLSKLFFLSTPLLVSLFVTITTIIFSTSIILTVFADYANQQTESNYDLREVPADYFDSSSIYNFLSFKDLYSKNQYPNVNIQKIECRNSNFNLNGITTEIHQNYEVTNDEQGPTTNPLNKGIEEFIDKSFNIDKNEIELCFNVNLNGQIVKSIEDPISATLAPVVPNDAKSDDLTVKMLNELPSERIKINSDNISSNENLAYADIVDSIITFQNDVDKGDSSENEVDTGSEDVDTGSEDVDTGS